VIQLVETNVIPTSPEQVWRFFAEMDEHYRKLNREHLTWRTLNGEPLAEGTIWFADEWVGPLRVSSRFFVERVEPGQFFSYRVGFPGRLAGAGGSFRFTPTSAGQCEMREEVHFGFKIRLVGLLLDQLLALLLPIKEFRRHIREEGENLVTLFSQDSAVSSEKDSSLQSS
jgi:hypothetical protein